MYLQQESQKSSYETLQREKEEADARSEMQCSLLSENLTTVRTDLTVAEGRVEELTRVNDQLHGEKLGTSFLLLSLWFELGLYYHFSILK